MAKKQKVTKCQVIDAKAVWPGRFSYDGLQRVFHEKARLGIMTCLMSHREGLAFPDLKELCALSDGNLNRHLEVLKEAELIDVEKVGAGRGAKSTVKITRQGQTAFLRYLSELRRVIEDASRSAAQLSSIDTKVFGSA